MTIPKTKSHPLRSNKTFSVYERKTNAPWIIFVHGLQTSKALFEPCFNNKFFESYSLLAIDLIGFGDSSKPKDFEYSIESHANAIIELLKHLKIDRCYFIGHSLGGMIGTYLLNQHADLFYALISMEGNLQLDDCGESANIEKMSVEEFKAKRYPELLEQLRCSNTPSAQVRFQSISKVPSDIFYKNAVNIVKASKSGKLLGLFEQSNRKKLLMIGDSSGYISRPNNENTDYTIISNATHFMTQDNPEDSYSKIQAFIASSVALDVES